MINNTGFIKIEEPCHERWQTMTITEQGRFCSSCKKHVHDFTNASPDEIKKAYEENSGNLCGKISGKLLNQQYVESQVQRIHFSQSGTFCFALILCFGASLFTMQ
ncbi:MAG: hypothetical protein ACXVED_18800, partial [Bacteroidia bacterium]